MKLFAIGLMVAACAPESSDRDGSEGDVSGSGDGSGSSDGGAGSGSGGDSGGSSSGGTGDTGTAPLEGTVRILTSSPVLLPLSEGGALQVSCLLDNDGDVQQLTSAGVTVSPTNGVAETDGAWTFEEVGSYVVTCATGESSAATEVRVVGEVMSRDAARVSAAISEMEGALLDVLIANNGDDDQFVAAHQRLVASLDTGIDELPMPWRNVPDAFWPDTETLVSAGVTPNADDEALGPAIAELAATISSARETLANQDPSATTEDHVATMAAHDDAITAAAAAFTQLEPTMHGWYAHGDTLQTSVLEPMVALSNETTSWHVAQLQAEAGEVLPPFGLLSLVTGSVMQGSLRLNLANHLYSDAIAAIDISINNLIAIEAISTAMPPTGDLFMEYVYASSSLAYAVPGYDTRIYGSGFSTKPGMNQFFIVGVDWQGTVDTIMDGCGLGSGSLLERLEAASDCIDSVRDTVDASYANGSTVANDGVFSEQVVGIGPFPNVCGDGWIPVTIGIMAMNLETGSRSSFTTLTCLP